MTNVSQYWLTCPKCGERLIERTNRETDEPFLGCTQWPDCTFTRPLPEHVKLRRLGAIPLPGME